MSMLSKLFVTKLVIVLLIMHTLFVCLHDKSRESKKEFSYDYSYWSAEASSPHFISQEKVSHQAWV